MFCLSKSYELEKSILNLILRLYNQRFALAKKSRELLLLFDADNISLFKVLTTQLKVLNRLVDESEIWLKLSDEKSLNKCQELFTFLRDL